MTNGARLDRSLTLGVFGPLRRAGVGRCAIGMPVLMYHGVSDDAEDGRSPYYRVTTNPQRFAEQMQWISELGFSGVSVEEGLRQLAEGTTNRHPAVAISFDDGFRDFHTMAWPALRRHNFTATMYLPTAFISQQRKTFRGKECLSWDEVRELRREGVRFGSHTVSHPKLHELGWRDIDLEITISKDRIEQELQEPMTSFAYPFAFPQEDRRFVERFVGLLRKAGYKHCATTVIGRVRAGDDLFCLKRLPANSCDDEALFAAKLDGAYDWFSGVQRAFRQVKGWAGLAPQRHD
jgi:peptidoglycan/xylan/chitin deacetylase (PgdA/CDA1 family)